MLPHTVATKPHLWLLAFELSKISAAQGHQPHFKHQQPHVLGGAHSDITGTEHAHRHRRTYRSTDFYTVWAGKEGGGPIGSLSIQSQRRGMTMAQGSQVMAGVAGEVSSVLAGDQAGDPIRPFPGSLGSVHSLLGGPQVRDEDPHLAGLLTWSQTGQPHLPGPGKPHPPG